MTDDEPSRLRRMDELGLGTWDVIVLLSTVLVAVVMPLELVFGMASSNWLIAASAAVSAIFAVDIGRRLAGARDRSRYLRTWFTVDLLAAIPFDLVAELMGEGPGANAFRALALLRVLRIARILALQRRWRVRTSLNPAVLRLSFFGFWIALVSHWIACGWIALGGPDFAHPEISPYQQALYWTITTLTTVGYGDIVPQGSGPIAYTMVVMGLGAAMYGYIIGNVASLLANIDVLRSRHLSRLETIGNFMRDRQVPRHLQAQVRDYYNYLWESRAGQQSEMLDDLPAPLRTEIALHLNRNVLRKVPLFSDASEVFLRELVLHFESVVAIPGEAIVRRGEVGHRIYFINKGTVEVLSRDESEVVATLKDGDFFGEGALLTSLPRSNTVRAVDYCNLFALNREHFDHVLEDFPDFADKVRRVDYERRSQGDSPETGVDSLPGGVD
ncbi:MAG: ion transporter [Acidimicrobiia bacterium]|nr:ion transporter [Acidimicrobiia bacterium]